jgi:hypothetical protein
MPFDAANIRDRREIKSYCNHKYHGHDCKDVVVELFFAIILAHCLVNDHEHFQIDILLEYFKLIFIACCAPRPTHTGPTIICQAFSLEFGYMFSFIRHTLKFFLVFGLILKSKNLDLWLIKTEKKLFQVKKNFQTKILRLKKVWLQSNYDQRIQKI